MSRYDSRAGTLTFDIESEYRFAHYAGEAQDLEMYLRKQRGRIEWAMEIQGFLAKATYVIRTKERIVQPALWTTHTIPTSGANPMQVINTLTTPTTPAQRSELEELEDKLFLAREEVEVLWLHIGEYCAEIVDKKLYKYARDENGNYFRTAKAYFTDLDRRFREKGWHLSTTTLNRYIQDHRLVEKYDITPQQALTLGKSNLEAIAPAVRKLEKEGKGDAAIQLVREVVDAAVANEGLPLSEVQQAVSQVTGRVMKGLEVRFEKGMFGQKLSKLILHWDERPYDLLKMEVTDEMKEWLERRLGIRNGSHLT